MAVFSGLDFGKNYTLREYAPVLQRPHTALDDGTNVDWNYINYDAAKQRYVYETTVGLPAGGVTLNVVNTIVTNDDGGDDDNGGGGGPGGGNPGTIDPIVPGPAPTTTIDDGETALDGGVEQTEPEEEPDEPTDIPDTENPAGPAIVPERPETEIIVEEIEDTDMPFSPMPKTGQAAGGGAAATTILSALAGLAIMLKKKKK